MINKVTRGTMLIEVDYEEHKATVDVYLNYEPNYGADRDGNRGIGKWEVTNFEVLEVNDEDFNNFDKSFRDIVTDQVSDGLDDYLDHWFIP